MKLTVKILIFFLALLAFPATLKADFSTREERKEVAAGNEAYSAKDYKGARAHYKAALKSNPLSLSAHFNIALTMVRIAEALPDNKKQEKEKLLEEARREFDYVAQRATQSPGLAAKAFYNQGNMDYLAQSYQQAVDAYKSALRLNPVDSKARKNLRLAQLKLKQQKKDDKKQDKNKDQQDKKDQNKKEDKKQDQQQNKDDKKENKEQQPPKQQPKQQPQNRQGEMSDQAADRILKRSSDKEKETMKKSMLGKQPTQSTSRKNW